jgi:hypothetical protein
MTSSNVQPSLEVPSLPLEVEESSTRAANTLEESKSSTTYPLCCDAAAAAATEAAAEAQEASQWMTKDDDDGEWRGGRCRGGVAAGLRANLHDNQNRHAKLKQTQHGDTKHSAHVMMANRDSDAECASNNLGKSSELPLRWAEPTAAAESIAFVMSDAKRTGCSSTAASGYIMLHMFIQWWPLLPRPMAATTTSMAAPARITAGGGKKKECATLRENSAQQMKRKGIAHLK